MASPKTGLFMAALGVLGIIGAITFAKKAKASPGGPYLPEPTERSDEQEADYNALTQYVTNAAAAIQNRDSKGARKWANAIKNHKWNDPNIKAAAMKEANKIDMAAIDIEEYNAAMAASNPANMPGQTPVTEADIWPVLPPEWYT